MTSKFKRQLKKYTHTPKVLERLSNCGKELIRGELSFQWENHKLQGEYEGFYELHLFPDVLLIYEIKEKICFLAQIGSHSELFG